MKKRHLFILLVLLVSLWPSESPATVPDFPKTHRVGTVELQMTGSALLKWAMLFDVYSGAFYLPENIPPAEWVKEVPKHLELSYLRNFKAEDFSSSSDKLLRENLPDDRYQQLAARLKDFYQLFQDIRPGDSYSLTYKPGTGTELRLNGELLGIATGQDFAEAYFGLWIGPTPISESFRDKLLGS